MPFLPESLTSLIASLTRLPGIGPRSAERMALHLIQGEAGEVQLLADNLVRARERVRFCDVCGALTEKSPCDLCTDPRRDAALLCVVERPVDIISLEKSGTFRGKYHVLGGKISPLDGLKITRIAHGLPAGTGLEFADELTLTRALEGRRELIS